MTDEQLYAQALVEVRIALFPLEKEEKLEILNEVREDVLKEVVPAGMVHSALLFGAASFMPQSDEEGDGGYSG